MRLSLRPLLGLCLLAVITLAGIRLAAHLRETDIAAEAAPPDGQLVATDLQGIVALELGP